MSENKIKFPVKLASNNPKSFGIVDATEVSGHRSVDTLSGLYTISDPVLSVLKDGSDAIGQEWFVVSEGCKYRLDNWKNRKSVAGWTKLPKQELINTKQSISEKDQPNGYAGLDSNGKIPIEKTYGTTATVVDVATHESLPAVGLDGVIYNVLNTGAQYKWSGSTYINITNGIDNAKKNETSIFDCSNGTSTKYYSSLSDAINTVPLVYKTSNRIISYLSVEYPQVELIVNKAATVDGSISIYLDGVLKSTISVTAGMTAIQIADKLSDLTYVDYAPWSWTDNGATNKFTLTYGNNNIAKKITSYSYTADSNEVSGLISFNILKEGFAPTAVNYQYSGIDNTTWIDLTKWQRIPNQTDLVELRSELSESLDEVLNKLIETSYDQFINKGKATFDIPYKASYGYLVICPSFDLKKGESVSITVSATINNYSRNVRIVNNADTSAATLILDKLEYNNSFTYTATQYQKRWYIDIGSSADSDFHIEISKNESLINTVEDLILVGSADEWNKKYPEGFGRVSSSETGVADNLPLSIYADIVDIEFTPLSEQFSLNTQLRLVDQSGAEIILDGFSNISRTSPYVKFSIKSILESKGYDITQYKSIYLRLMQSTDPFYGKFKITSFKQYSLTSVVDGKVDKEQGKGLSSNDFTIEYKNKIDEIDELKNSMKGYGGSPEQDLFLNGTAIFNISYNKDSQNLVIVDPLDLKADETLHISVTATPNGYTRYVRIYNNANVGVATFMLAKDSTQDNFKYKSNGYTKNWTIAINSLADSDFSIQINKESSFIQDVDNSITVGNVDEWNEKYPDGFGRESNSDAGVADNIQLSPYADTVDINFEALSDIMALNTNIRVFIEGVGDAITLAGFSNISRKVPYLKFNFRSLLKAKGYQLSQVKSAYIRLMQSTDPFYGKFKITSFKQYSLTSVVDGKVDKEFGKGLSTNDFTDYYKTKLVGLSNYDDADLQKRVEDLEETGASKDAVQEAVQEYLAAHPEATTSVADGSLTWQKFSSETQKKIRNNIINVQDFGAKGDGVTDDYDSLKAVFNSLKDGDIVYFPHGTYIVDFQGSIPIVSNDQQASDYRSIKRGPCMTIDKANITIIGNNSTINIPQTMFWEYILFDFKANATNFVIKDFNLVGDYKDHVYTKFYYNSTNYYSHEFGYGIFVRGNGLIQNCNISFMVGDAIVTKNSSTIDSLTGSGAGGEIVINNCDLGYCRRQGLSVLDSDDITVKNSYIHDIGDLPSLNLIGTSPMGGVDLEPGSGTKQVRSFSLINSIIRNCPKSITNGDITGENIKNVNIINSECGTVSIGSKAFARNSTFVIDSNKVQFGMSSDSVMIGCDVVIDVPTTISLPKAINATIVNNSGDKVIMHFGNGLYDCVVEGISFTKSSSKGEIINTTFIGCDLQHTNSDEIITFNGCSIKDLTVSDYSTGSTTTPFTADGLVYNKCLLMNEPSYGSGTPIYNDCTKV